MSSVSVVGNSLLLARYKPRFASIVARERETIHAQKRLEGEKEREKVYAAQPK